MLLFFFSGNKILGKCLLFKITKKVHFIMITLVSIFRIIYTRVYNSGKQFGQQQKEGEIFQSRIGNMRSEKNSHMISVIVIFVAFLFLHLLFPGVSPIRVDVIFPKSITMYFQEFPL